MGGLSGTCHWEDEEVEEWLMAPVTPSRATVTVPRTYEVGGPSTATPMGHTLTTMASGVATEWLMAPVTPSRATVIVPRTYEVGGPSTATPMGHPLTTMASGVATQPQVIDDLCVRMSNLEYRHAELVKKMEIVSDAEVADSIAIGDIHPRVTTLEGQNNTYVWGDKKDEAFCILKEKLCNASVLALPDGPNDFVVYCDASKQGKANVVADALSRKERLKPRRVHAMSITIHSGIKTKILEAHGEASNDLKAPVEWLRGLETHFERRDGGGIYYFDRIWIPSVSGVRKLIMDEAHTSKYSIHP
nr:putative reverse transcriptase domain-containing protein [Tanacetum cinerariifolium]